MPVAVLWLLLVRAVERTDSQEEGVPDQKHVDEVRRYEDFGAQNPFTGVGEVKPGLVRLVTMRVALAGSGPRLPARLFAETISPASTRSISPAGCCSTTTAG